jgi:hypothetical protein
LKTTHWVATVAFAGLATSPAWAHQAGLSFLDVTVHGPRVEAALDVPGPELVHAVQLDANRDGLLDRADVEAASAAAARWMANAVHLVSDGRICEPEPQGARLREDQLVTVSVAFRCPDAPSSLQLTSRLHEGLGEGHTTIVRGTRDGVTAQGMVNAGSSSLALDFSGAGALGTFGRFVRLGAGHIFTGYDHVLFLLTLIVLGGSLRRVVGIATSFTAAHSLTLSLAALGVVTGLSSRLVESAIAASIAYVAVENYLLARRPDGAPEPLVLRYRWVLTFAFGLVHGFGFAGALEETGLPREHVPLALAAFNLGVEAGQVAIVAAVWPLVARASRRPWFHARLVPWSSLGVLAVATYWFVDRVRG